MRPIVLLATLLPLALLLHGADAKSDLSCNVMLNNWGDLIRKTAGKTDCMIRVERAYQRCGSKSIGILPYQTFLFEWKKFDTKSVAFMSGIRFSLPRNGGTSGRLVLKTPDQAAISQFSRGLQECLVHAVKVGFTTIAITPHLNAPKNKLWRNWLAFSPFAAYNGTTYKNAIINPIVSAAKAAIANGAQIRLALQGEMNMAIAMYPKEWNLLLKETKAALGPKAKVGVSMNWNKVCGEYCRFYPGWLFAPKKADYRILMNSVDFIGVSSYPNVWPSYQINPGKMDFDASLKYLDQELKDFVGVGLADLAARGKQLQWSEFGVGGGCDSSAACTATNLQTIASVTYAMVAGPYGRFKDPWTPKWARDFRYYYHQQAIRKLNGAGPFPISYAFMWSTGSMDVCAVDPTSITTKGSFYSPSICGMINNYNRKKIVP